VAPAAGLLLTGGASRRLGVAKAMLRLGDESLADRLARVLALVVSPVLEVGPGYSPLPAVREEPPGSGPLLAFLAGADELAARGVRAPVVVLAVDLPRVDMRIVRWLASHPAPGSVVPVVDGVMQTVCARYGVDALLAARGIAASGARSLRALVAAVPVHEAPEAEWRAVADRETFADVDTPDDVTALGLSLPG
jgi:molybdopterin-guanine dinucleotide biosynthesis protein A